MHLHTHMRARAHTHTYTHTHTHTYLHAHTQSQSHTIIFIYVCVCVCMSMHGCISQAIKIYISMYVHCTSVILYVYIFLCVCIYTRMHIYRCTHVNIWGFRIVFILYQLTFVSHSMQYASSSLSASVCIFNCNCASSDLTVPWLFFTLPHLLGTSNVQH